MKLAPIASALALAAGLFASQPASAVELTWDEGVTRIRTSVESRDYSRARETLVILLRDYPSRDAVFELDVRFSVGDVRDASALLSHLAHRDPASLFDLGRVRASQWDTFKVQLDALEYYVAQNPVDDGARLLLGYYLLISGMPMRGERIFERLHTECPQWEVAQILLDASRGKTGHYHGKAHIVVQPPIPEPPQPGGSVVITIVTGPGTPDPRPARPVPSPERPRLTARAGAGALFLPDGLSAPLSKAAIGLKSAQGYTYELQLGASAKMLIPQGDTRKEVSLNTVGLGFGYAGKVAHKTHLQPVVGMGAEVLAASPLAATTSYALGLTGRLGLDLAIPVRQGELRLGVEGNASRPLALDANFPVDLPLFFHTAGTLGLSF